MALSVPLEALTPAWLAELESLAARWQGGDATTQPEIQEALALWRERLQLPASPGEEWFDIVNAAGEPTGLQAPRWFAHLTGLRHRVVHVLLMTPQGLLALQMRSHTKPEWPDRLDTTVGGHLKAGQTWHAGVLEEIHEELGLAPADIHRWLGQTQLIPVGAPFERYKWDPATPHLRNRQVLQLFTGQITAWGLAHLHFADHELDGLYLTPPDEARRLVETRPDRIAPGLRTVFPHWWTYFTRASAPPR
jgi:hypothetical protein